MPPGEADQLPDFAQTHIACFAALLTEHEPWASRLYSDLKQQGCLSALEALAEATRRSPAILYPEAYVKRAIEYGMLRYLGKERREAEHISLEDVHWNEYGPGGPTSPWGSPDPVSVEDEALSNAEQDQAFGEADLTSREADAIRKAMMGEPLSNPDRQRAHHARRKLRAAR